MNNTRKPRARRELERKPEFRTRTITSGEMRASADAESGLIAVEGQVIVYNVPYEVNDMWGTFTETIHNGACTELLESPLLDVRFLYNHGGMPLARTGAAASLECTESDSGLNIRALIDPRMSLANDLQVALERGIVTQMSVGMEVASDGDIWSGDDGYGMPDTRNIVRLANVFDASAVTFPASPTTSIALARSAWAGMPVDSRERTRKMWNVAADIRANREVSQADADALMHTLEQLHSVDADEERSAPTAQDDKVADQITVVAHAIADLKAAQAKDPDANTDSDDKKVSSAIAALSDALDAVTAAQSKDGNPEPEEKPEPEDDKSEDDKGSEDEKSDDSKSDDNRAAKLKTEQRQRMVDADMDLINLHRGSV